MKKLFILGSIFSLVACTSNNINDPIMNQTFGTTEYNYYRASYCANVLSSKRQEGFFKQEYTKMQTTFSNFKEYFLSKYVPAENQQQIKGLAKLAIIAKFYNVPIEQLGNILGNEEANKILMSSEETPKTKEIAKQFFTKSRCIEEYSQADENRQFMNKVFMASNSHHLIIQ